MKKISLLLLVSLLFSCEKNQYTKIDRLTYKDQLEGFWLGQCIANWTGLVTEMDKIGVAGEINTGAFYTREDWGKPDQPSIWGEGVPSDLSETIDFVFRGPDQVWGADDDTDIEYMYQHLLSTGELTPERIREGWLKHIKLEEENYLWVSNQRALDLMVEGFLPPQTGDPQYNEHYNMIDAQLTTEIFGLYAPARPDVAIEIAELPIQTTARKEAEQISKFYVSMYALASKQYMKNNSMKERVFQMAEESKSLLEEEGYARKMYDFVKAQYDAGCSWEQSRDALYQRYQVEQKDGYDISSRNLYCNGCFAAGINFAASLVSLFYGEGDYIETVKIGTLCGWDSDNPTATWGGMLGFMLGKKEIETLFNQQFSDQFYIHRTRQNFPNQGMDNFSNMAQTGLDIVDRVVLEKIGGKIENDSWLIPNK
ncbi:MAG: ADP-ribosylglycohydrolase family protein [Flavobacteriaceae bacterium]